MQDLSPIHEGLLVTLYIIVSQRFNGLLLCGQLTLEQVKFNPILLDDLFLFLKVLLELLQLFSELIFVGFEEPNLLTFDLVLDSPFLDGFCLAFEVLLFNTVFIKLFLKFVVFDAHLVVFLVEKIELLLEGMLFFDDILHLVSHLAEFNFKITLGFFTLS